MRQLISHTSFGCGHDDVNNGAPLNNGIANLSLLYHHDMFSHSQAAGEGKDVSSSQDTYRNFETSPLLHDAT